MSVVINVKRGVEFIKEMHQNNRSDELIIVFIDYKRLTLW